MPDQSRCPGTRSKLLLRIGIPLRFVRSCRLYSCTTAIVMIPMRVSYCTYPIGLLNYALAASTLSMMRRPDTAAAQHHLRQIGPTTLPWPLPRVTAQPRKAHACHRGTGAWGRNGEPPCASATFQQARVSEAADPEILCKHVTVQSAAHEAGARLCLAPLFPEPRAELPRGPLVVARVQEMIPQPTRPARNPCQALRVGHPYP